MYLNLTKFEYYVTSSLEPLVMAPDVVAVVPFVNCVVDSSGMRVTVGSLLLYSVSSTVFTVFVEWPCTRPNDDLPWWLLLVNFDASRKRSRDFALGVTTCRMKWPEISYKYVYYKTFRKFLLFFKS